MRRLILWLIQKLPLEEILAAIVSVIANIAFDAAKELLDRTIEKVAEVERKLGAAPGEEKARIVKQWLRENFGLAEKKWLVNLLVELAVALAKKKGLIR